MLAGDPAAADPVCSKSPAHSAVTEAVARAQQSTPPSAPLVFRDPRASRRLLG
jgi:pyrroloquinoline quinone biosynthesis protein E